MRRMEVPSRRPDVIRPGPGVFVHGADTYRLYALVSRVLLWATRNTPR